MVGGQARGHKRPRNHLPLDDPWTFHNLSKANQGDLRRIDHTEDSFHSLFTEAGDRDRRIGEFGAAQRSCAGPLHDILEPFHQLVETLFVCMVNGRCHKASLPEGNRHTDVDVMALNSSVSFPQSIQLRYLPQRQGHCLNKQDAIEQPIRHRPFEVFSFEPGHGPAHVDDSTQVVMRNLALRSGHRCGNGLSYTRLAISGYLPLTFVISPEGKWTGEGDASYPGGAENVVADDGSVWPCAFQGRRINTQLCRQLSRSRRDAESSWSCSRRWDGCFRYGRWRLYQGFRLSLNLNLHLLKWFPFLADDRHHGANWDLFAGPCD